MANDILDIIGTPRAVVSPDAQDFSNPFAGKTADELNEKYDETQERIAQGVLRELQEAAEVAYQREQVFEIGKQELNFFAPLALPEVFEFNFPPTFVAIWQLLTTRVFLEKDFTRIALGIPRGFAKTTLMKIFILYCICYTNRRFILIVCAAESLAENILADVVDMLDEPNIKHIFGDWRVGIEKDTQKVKKFGFRGRNINLVALGAGSSLRGLNLKHQRPDVILMDDIQKAEEADSLEISDKLLRWMLGTLMKASNKRRCLYIFVGNMYAGAGSILRKLKHNSTWVSFIAGGILADGESIWPELQSKEQLLQEFANDIEMGHPEIFCAEVLNDETAGSRSGIDISKIPAVDDALFEVEPQGNFIIIDPSNDKKNSDNAEIGYFEIYDGVNYSVELVSGVMSPTEIITNTLKLALKRNCKVICVESNAYQYSLLHWFNHFCIQYQIEGLHLCELYATISKNARIKDMLRELEQGRTLRLANGVRSLVINEVVNFNPIRKDNIDNKLDVLAYHTKAVEMYGHLMTYDGAIAAQEVADAQVLEEHENCSF